VDSGKLLVIDNDLAGRAILTQRLARSGYAVEVAGVGAEAIEKIRKERFDLVLLDQSAPNGCGMDLLALLRATFSRTELPVIMVTAAHQIGSPGEVLDRAANDYLTKPGEFLAAPLGIETKLSRAQAECQAIFTDPLTGLGNRTLLMDKMESALAAGSASSSVALLVVNLDGFKLLNASLGQRAGDRLLLSIANRLRVAFGETALARIGGDEFAILLEGEDTGVQSCGRLEELSSAVVACFEHPFLLNETSLTITASVGGSACADRKTSADELWREADLAMRRAKELGKNRWELFDPAFRERMQARACMGVDLHHAAARGELVAYYQPKVHLPSRTVVGFEALLRWKHPTRGLVPPGEFISVAEELGLIVPIGEWILAEACRQIKTWQRKFADGDRLSMNVNLSVKQLHDPALVSRVESILKETGIDPSTLKLELTESALIKEVHSAKDTLSQLRALGVGLKLDDFGTGYSSLNYLRTLHFDSLKIDRSFIARLARDLETQAIVATIINLAHALHMEVVAEGIETEPQLKKLIEMGCETGQGYYFSKPVSASQAERLLRPVAA